MRCTRRTLLQVMGAGAAAMALPGCSQDGRPIAGGIAPWTEQEETWKCSVCRLCPGGCGLLVRIMDGRPVRVLGNPLHPVNRGGLCPRGTASLEILHDEDRLTHPLLRDGERGGGRWRPITWEEAGSMMAKRLADLRSTGKPERLVLIDGQEWGIRGRIIDRFAMAYGTPNRIRFRPLEPERISLAHALMQGGTAPLAYDLAHSSYLLCFGAGLLESGASPISQMRAFAEIHAGEGGQRGRVAVVDPRLSVTAARADLWVPIRPGTEGALAMGIAYVILRESLHDKAFVENHTFGFEDWVDETGRSHMGWKSLVLSEYNPLSVSEITGVRTETILTLAREFATAKPALALVEPEFSFGPNDFYARMAIHALNALTGNLTGPGTFAVQGAPPISPLPDPILDETARLGLSRPRIDGAGTGVHLLSTDAVQALPAHLQREEPYPAEILIFLNANPLFSHPAKEELAAALSHVGWIVSVGPYLDESARQADLVLPDASFLERWDGVEARQHAGFSLFSLSEPAVAPIGEARDAAQVFLETASAIGGSVAGSMPWKGVDEILQQVCRGLFEAERGYVVSDGLEESFRRILERQGLRDPEFDSFDEFWSALRSRGVWWDPTDTANDAASLIQTESRRFEFYSHRLEARLGSAGAAFDPGRRSTREELTERARGELQIRAGGDRLFLPHHEPIADADGVPGYPLRLRPFLLLALGQGEMANVPWIQEGLAVHTSDTWESWVELNPKTASTLGVREGDMVWVESRKGRVRVRARLFEGIMPETAAMPLGQGHLSMGVTARGRGANPWDLVEDMPDSRAGMAVVGLTPIRIVKA